MPINPGKSWKENTGISSWKDTPTSIKWNSKEQVIEETVTFSILNLMTGHKEYQKTNWVFFDIGAKTNVLTKMGPTATVSFTIGADLDHELQAVYSGTQVFALTVDQAVQAGQSYSDAVSFSFKGDVTNTAYVERSESVVFDMKITEFAVDGDGIFLDFVTMDLGAKAEATSAGSFMNVETVFDVELGFTANSGKSQEYNHVVSFTIGTDFEYFNTQWNRPKPTFGDWTAEQQESGNDWTPDVPASGDWN